MHRCLAYVIHLPGAATSSYTAILVLRFFSTYFSSMCRERAKSSEAVNAVSDRVARPRILLTRVRACARARASDRFTSPCSFLFLIECRQTRHRIASNEYNTFFPLYLRAVSRSSFFSPSFNIARAIIISPFIVCRNIFITDYPRGVSAAQLVHSRPTPSILGLPIPCVFAFRA